MVDMKFVMCSKKIKKICNSMIKFLKYAVMLICLVKVVALQLSL